MLLVSLFSFELAITVLKCIFGVDFRFLPIATFLVVFSVLLNNGFLVPFGPVRHIPSLFYLPYLSNLFFFLNLFI